MKKVIWNIEEDNDLCEMPSVNNTEVLVIIGDVSKINLIQAYEIAITNPDCGAVAIEENNIATIIYSNQPHIFEINSEIRLNQNIKVEKYNIKVNTIHLEILIKALDLYSRFYSGQFSEIIHLFTNGAKNIKQDIEWDKCLKICLQLGHEIFGFKEIYQILSLSDTDERGKIAYDIKTVLDYHKSWSEKPEGGITVNFDEPIQVSEQPLPKVEIER